MVCVAVACGPSECDEVSWTFWSNLIHVMGKMNSGFRFRVLSDVNCLADTQISD